MDAGLPLPTTIAFSALDRDTRQLQRWFPARQCSRDGVS